MVEHSAKLQGSAAVHHDGTDHHKGKKGRDHSGCPLVKPLIGVLERSLGLSEYDDDEQKIRQRFEQHTKPPRPPESVSVTFYKGSAQIMCLN